MVNVVRLLLPFISSGLPSQAPLSSENGAVQPKSVAIVGTGSAGLAMIKTLLDLPEDIRRGLDISVYEERESVAGVWLPDRRNVTPPEIPETPLYPLLHTNTPVPFMTYPGFPFPTGTELYPSHEAIEAYHLRYAKHYNLLPLISFNHEVREASWSGTPEQGHWNLTILDRISGTLLSKKVDHLVVATGNNHIPSIPTWKGQDAWLDATPPNSIPRRILHSVYYREPNAFAGQRVLVVGNGASGRDAASQIVKFSKEIILSVRGVVEDPIVGVQYRPEIAEFTAGGIIFTDGTRSSPDVVLLGTGYEFRKPFLERGGALRIDTHAHDNTSFAHGGPLLSNLRYIFPLHRHILSLSDTHPVNALAFIGLVSYIPNCPSDVAQSLFAAHAIVHPHILPPRAELLRELAAYDERIRAAGLDPYTNGHRMIRGSGPSDYQDELVDFLTEKGVIPDTGKKFVEEWRRAVYGYQALKRGWMRIRALGTGEEWTAGAQTEAQWADVMRRVNEWQERWEREQGLPFILDPDLPA